MKADEKKCPRCAETIKLQATVCKHCGYEFSPSEIKAEAAKRSKQTLIGCGVGVAGLLAISTCVAVTGGGGESTEGSGNAAADAAATERAEADRRRSGFHCLSAWDGSHNGLVEGVKRSLRNPDSFQHTETRITPVDKKGDHMLFMEYRAQNGFGGMNIAKIAAKVKNADCSYEVVASDDDAM